MACKNIDRFYWLLQKASRDNIQHKIWQVKEGKTINSIRLSWNNLKRTNY